MFMPRFSPNRSRKHRVSGGRARPKQVCRLSLEALEARKLLSGYRSIDGTGNNLANPEWGAAGTDLLRLAPAAYDNGISSPAGADRLSPRAISNGIVAQGSDVAAGGSGGSYRFQLRLHRQRFQCRLASAWRSRSQRRGLHADWDHGHQHRESR
jgi:hypothetical protein